MGLPHNHYLMPAVIHYLEVDEVVFIRLYPDAVDRKMLKA
jgi:hypothetical protein